MSKIQITNAHQQTAEIELQTDLTLMELLRENGYDEITAICGGCCSCATCHVHIDPASVELLVMEEDEAFLLEDEEHFDATRSRLSCQLQLQAHHAGMRVQLLHQE